MRIEAASISAVTSGARVAVFLIMRSIMSKSIYVLSAHATPAVGFVCSTVGLDANGSRDDRRENDSTTKGASKDTKYGSSGVPLAVNTVVRNTKVDTQVYEL